MIKNIIILLILLIGMYTTYDVVTNSITYKKSRVLDITLTPANTVTLRGVVSAESVADVSLKLMQNKEEKVYLVIDSPGGSIFAGLDLIRILRPLKNVEIICIYCASMAHIIFQHSPTRIITNETVLMAHRAYVGGVNGQINGEAESRLNHIKSVVDSIDEFISKKIGIDKVDYINKINNEWYLYGLTAIDEGHADRVANITCSDELTNSIEVKTEVVEMFGIPLGKVQLKYSNCPVLRFPQP